MTILVIAKAWFENDERSFGRPCGVIRGANMMSQPFFSKEVGLATVEAVKAHLSLADDECDILRRDILSSDLAYTRNVFDMAVHIIAVELCLSALSEHSDISQLDLDFQKNGNENPGVNGTTVH
ncbi:MAG: hypothetical protein NTW66_02790 [Candidatus Magasanikbacteria bacterium]|nr:hypothetical protein [Candidatus Magasanikbacteria bacterium]